MGEPFLHDTVLNRLETYLEYGNDQVFFSRESFSNNLDAWAGIPVIYAEVVNGAVRHPDFSSVTNRTLPDGFRFAGIVNYAYIPEDGNPRLSAMLCITDPEVDAIAQAGKLGISTGFTASEIPYELGYRLSGDVTPNHVLVFTQGACPNCYGRDNAAMFLNIQETPTMTDTEEKTILQRIADKLYNLAYQVEETEESPAEVVADAEVENTTEAVAEEPVAEVVEEVTEEEVAVENTEAPAEETPVEDTAVVDPAEHNNVMQENEQLKNTIAEMEQKLKDIEWSNVRATVPQGWLGEKEAEYREKFENNKDAFYKELMAHEHTFPNTKAEGEKICPCKLEAELKNIVSENAKKIGYTPME